MPCKASDMAATRVCVSTDECEQRVVRRADSRLLRQQQWTDGRGGTDSVSAPTDKVPDPETQLAP